MGIQKQYKNFRPIIADLTKNADIAQLGKVLKDAKLPLHLVVQNAGMKSPPRPLTQYTSTQIDEVLQLNLLAPMKLVPLLADHMAPHSRMLFVTSRAATLQLKEGSTYCASKAGLNQVAAIVRQELPNVAIACVIPGEVDTEIQKTIRETKSFHLYKQFEEAYETGQLISPKTCAEFLAWMVCDMPYEDFANSDIPISIYDEWHHASWLKDPKDLPPFPFD